MIVMPPVKVLRVFANPRDQVPAPLFTMASFPPDVPLVRMPTTLPVAVLLPLRLSVVVLPAVDTPETFAILSRLVPEVAFAVNVAEPPLP